jgi:hypothetical protein
VTVDVSGELIHDPEAELRMHMARQQAAVKVAAAPGVKR